jgi:hypothetical protein
MGETAPVVAQSLDQAWWYIQNPDDVNICAVPKDGTVPAGDTGDIPLWNNPEIVAEEDTGSGPLTCNINLNETQCLAAGGEWHWLRDDHVGGGYCTCD